MRVLFSCTPATGEFHPLVPLVLALRAAGHAVAFATAEEMRPRVEALGCAFFPAGRTGRALGAQERFPEVFRVPLAERATLIRRLVHAGLRVEVKLPQALAAAAAWQPDVIVRDSWDFTGCLVAEKLGLPHATMEVWAVGGRIYDRAATAAPLNAWREQLGLAPDPDLVMLDRYLTFVPFPRSFRPPGDPVPRTAHYLRPGVFNTSGDETLPPWLEHVPSLPVVHMTLGTVFNAQDGLVSAAIEGLAGAALTFVVTIGRDQDPAALGSLPANVYVERYLPHSQLLPRCDLVVSHAGAGTVTAACWYGLPQLAVPLAADQFENAAMLVRLGAGEQLTAAERTPAHFASAVKKLLEAPSYRTAAQEVQREMQALPPMDTAVALLERLVRERQPVLSDEQ